MSRYPYTEACDAMRLASADWSGLTVVSRAHASAIRSYIADALGMDDADLAKRIADYAKTQEVKP